jgi:hypothetical protein
MPAPTQGLVPETRRAEADHAELKRKIEALSSQYDNQMRLATIDLRQKSKAAYAEFERQHADIASQLAKSLRGSVEAVLRQKLELELDALQRAHREQEEARTRAYNEQRQKYEQAIFTTIDALIFAGVSLVPRTDRFSHIRSLISSLAVRTEFWSFSSAPITAVRRGRRRSCCRRWPGPWS